MYFIIVWSQSCIVVTNLFIRLVKNYRETNNGKKNFFIVFQKEEINLKVKLQRPLCINILAITKAKCYDYLIAQN